MAHSAPHKKVSTYLPVKEAKALEKLAKQRDRSVTAELRQAALKHLQDETA